MNFIKYFTNEMSQTQANQHVMQLTITTFGKQIPNEFKEVRNSNLFYQQIQFELL